MKISVLCMWSVPMSYWSEVYQSTTNNIGYYNCSWLLTITEWNAKILSSKIPVLFVGINLKLIRKHSPWQLAVTVLECASHAARKKDTSGSPQYWPTHSTIPTYQARGTHWCSYKYKCSGLTNNFLVVFEAYTQDEFFVWYSKSYQKPIIGSSIDTRVILLVLFL